MGVTPHCDSTVLHAPGECHYCDDYPQWQEARRVWGIAFTGREAEGGQLPCPSEVRRPGGVSQLWHGNRPASP